MKLNLIRACLIVILKQPHFKSFKISLMVAFKLWPGIFIQSNFRSTFKHAFVGNSSFETYDYESILFYHYKRIFHLNWNFITIGFFLFPYMYVDFGNSSFEFNVGSKLLKVWHINFFIWQGKQVTRVAPDVCKYPRSPAMGLGFTAALSLLFAQITIKASTGCVCCIRGPRPPKWRTAVICFTVSWYFSTFPFSS